MPTTIDFRNENARRRRDLEGFVEALLPTRIAADAKLDREDVEVPAGHFAQVIREMRKLDDGGQATRWFSPEIPFDGTIKRRTTEWEFLLLAYNSNVDTHEPTPTVNDMPTVSP